jgi:enoyl-CoA hydratase
MSSVLPSFEFLQLSEEAGTLVVTINRPEAMNALNASVLSSLAQMIDWVEKNTTVRAVILTGAGEKAFVAGADIKQFESMTPEGAKELSMRGQAIFRRLEELRVPVIAAVNGFALGGGLELALSCDFIYASDNAKFGLPECTLGLLPGYGGTVRLPRRVGAARAREMTYTGNMVGAPEALVLGLVAKIVPREELLKACLETTKVISSRAPVAVSMIKRSIHEGMSLTEDEALELEADLFGKIFATEDKNEGVRAFIEKRKPSFKGC